MAVIRRNILADEVACQQYIQGVKRLKAEFLGPSTIDIRIDGPAQAVSTYDLFVAWHHIAMNTFTPPDQTDRNAAHRGPAFLPWHRFMLVLFEQQLQRILDNPEFALPYWDWAADGQLSTSQQTQAAIWQAECIGNSGAPVANGPFAFNIDDPDSWRVRIESAGNGQMRQTERGLRRALAANPSVRGLPTKAQAISAVALTPYDAPPWNSNASGFRNRLEGWRPLASAPGMNNRVHVWIGGDMLPSSSPNDPVFYLSHCNTDRLWEAWLQRNNRIYLPAQNATETLQGHRIDDLMTSLVSEPSTPRQMLDLTSVYNYDTLS